jgi:hypothetical protein
MNNKYRIPELKEFVQGFKFERAVDYEFGILGQLNPFKKKRIWIKCEVWWKLKPDEIISKKDDYGNMWIYNGFTNNFFKPFDEESFIKQKLVRVKNEQQRKT